MGANAKKRIDFTEGPLFWRLVLFALPVMATGLLQMLYNAADKLVVGRFSGDVLALAAIGSTTYIAGFLINFMTGIGAGAGVVVAQAFGAKDNERTSRAVHTSLKLSFVMALAFTAVSYIIAEPLLILLGTTPELMSRALLYLRIYFVGIVATAVYNFSSAIFRAIGDSKTPLVIGTVAGFMNVVLNLFFVIVCKMSVEGVSIATVISQYFSAITAIVILAKRRGESYCFSFKKFKFDIPLLKRILRIGIPTGLQSTCFSITNMTTTSAINTFSTEYVTAFSVSGNIDGMLDVCAGAFMQSSLNATGQNFGAGKYKRIRKVFIYSLIQSMVLMFVFANTLRIFRAELGALFIDADDPNFDAIVAAVVEWTGVMLATYFLQGSMNAVLGTVRGLGYSLSPLILNLIGVCGSRIAWVYLVFPLEPFHNFGGLALLYPVSWGLTSLLLAIIAFVAFKKLGRFEKQRAERLEEAI